MAGSVLQCSTLPALLAALVPPRRAVAPAQLPHLRDTHTPEAAQQPHHPQGLCVINTHRGVKYTPRCVTDPPPRCSQAKNKVSQHKALCALQVPPACPARSPEQGKLQETAALGPGTLVKGWPWLSQSQHWQPNRSVQKAQGKMDKQMKTQSCAGSARAQGSPARLLSCLGLSGGSEVKNQGKLSGFTSSS